MTSTEIRLAFLRRLNEVFCAVFDDENLQITEETTASSIDEWDSLMHVTLVISVEKAFKVRLNSSEIGKLKNVGAMIDLLISRCSDSPFDLNIGGKIAGEGE